MATKKSKLPFSRTRLKADPYSYFTSRSREVQEAILDHLEELYHKKFKPIISDGDYDLCYDWFIAEYPDSGREDKIGHQVERLSSKREEVELPNFMPSLSKIKPETKELKKFRKDYPGPYVLGDKLDGISLQVIYEGGKPVEAYTRGDGTFGKDVSRHLKYFNIPKKIKEKKRISFRCEAEIDNPTFFAKYDEEAGGEYTAARNFVGGKLNDLKKSDKKAFKDISIIVYGIIEGPMSDNTLLIQLMFAEKLGLDVVEYKVVDDISSKFLSKYHAKRIKKSEFDIDGIVVTQNKPYEQSDKNPKHAKAFKENSEADMEIVTVERVEWNESKVGKFNPRVFYPLTKLGGVKNDKATGHNAFFITHGYPFKDRDKGLPVRPVGPGAKIKIVRSGKVIPYIHEVLEPSTSGKPDMPDSPYEYRNGNVEIYSTEVSDLAHAKAITHFFVTIGVDGLRLSSIMKFIEAGYDGIIDIMFATEEQIAEIEGFGAKKAKQWTTQIKNAKKNITAPMAADAFNIFEGFSKERLDKIFTAYPNVKKFAKYSRSKQIAKIEALGGFKKLAVEFVDRFPHFVAQLKALDIKLKKVEKKVASSNKLEGKFITFTGVRNAELTAQIEDMGGVVQSSKASTNLIIRKDADYTNNKIDKAIEDGKEVLTVQEFVDFYIKEII